MILVGVDGSPESREALRWALREAALRGAEVRCLYVYGPPEEYNPYALAYAGLSGHAEAWSSADAVAGRELQFRRLAESVLRGMLDELAEEGPGEVTVQAEAVPSTNPARVLIERSRLAELLVVGSRGRGGFAGLLLGSLSQQCAKHAHCPVVIIRGAGGEAVGS